MGDQTQAAGAYELEDQAHPTEPGLGPEPEPETRKTVRKGLVDETEESKDVQARPQYNSAMDAIIVMLGYAIGIGNLWRFPYLVGRHGGGAFLIPYLLSLVFVASPAYLLEFLIGQKFQRGAIEAFQMIHPSGAGIGYMCVLTVVGISAYYQTLLVWTLHYIVNAFKSPLPWESDTTGFFVNDVLHQVPTMTSPGAFDIPGTLLLALLAVYVMIYATLAGGLQHTGRVAYVTVIAPIILLIILFWRVIFLDGAIDGVLYYITPRFEPLADTRTWSLALGQIMFSLSPGMGTAIALASYNKKSTNVFRMHLIVSACNSAFSIFGGFVIFSVVGCLAKEENKSVEAIADSGPKLAFVVFAKAVSYLPLPQFWALIFFLMLLSLGLDSSFAMIESINTFLRDLCAKRKIPTNSALLTYLTCVSLFVMGLPFVTRAGQQWLDIFDHFVGVYCILIVVCFETIFVWRYYGFEKLGMDMKEMTNVSLPRFYLVTWRLIPFVIGTLLLVTLAQDIITPLGSGPDEASYAWFGQVAGWLSWIIPFGVMAFSYLHWHYKNRTPTQDQARNQEMELTGDRP